MRVDLDDLFTALATHADRIPLDPAESVRRRSRRRRQRIATRTAGLAVVALVATVGAVSLGRPTTPPADPAPTTVNFTSLEPAAWVQLDLSVRGTVGEFRNLARIVDGVAYLLGSPRNGSTRLDALDIASARLVFGSVDLGEFVDGMTFVAARSGLVVIGQREVGAAPVVVVLDPTSGRIRWQREEFGNVIVTESAIVTWNPSGGLIRALDWQTGDELWAGPSLEAGDVLAIAYPADAPVPATAYEPWLQVDRLIAAYSSGTVEVIDVRTGGIERRIEIRPPDPVSLGLANLPIAVGDTLYSQGGGEVWAYPLDRPGGPRLIYAHPEGGDVQTWPCGAPVRCLSVPAGSSKGHLVVLDPVTDEELWRSPAEGPWVAVGERLLANRGLLYDLSGNLVGEPMTHDEAWWISAESLLTLDFVDQTTAVVGGVSAQDGATMRLGEIPAPFAQGYGCAVDERYLVCPEVDGFHAWRFAAD